jgi:hypothetical protein
MTSSESFIRKQNAINSLTLKRAIPLAAKKLGVPVAEVLDKVFGTALYADLYNFETDVRYLSFYAIADALVTELRQQKS